MSWGRGAGGDRLLPRRPAVRPSERGHRTHESRSCRTGVACRPFGGPSLGGLPRRRLLGGSFARGRRFAGRCLLGGPGRSLGGCRSSRLARGGDGGVAGRVGTLGQLGCRSGGQDRILEGLHRRDARLLGRLDPDGFARCRVATHARRAVDLDEFGETRDGNGLTLRDDGGDDVSEAVDDGDHCLQLDVGLDRNGFC